MTLSDLQNRLWHLLREPGPDTGDQIVLIGDFSQPTVQRDLNIALQVFISETGLAPALTDKVVTLPITAGLDYTLPTDLASLSRVEYTQAQSGLVYPYPLDGYSFAAFDEATSDGAALTETGAPYAYREPYAGQIRLNPYPTAGNVAGGDTITLYYSSLGNTLVNLTDVPGIPVQFHMALVYYCLADYWPRKEEDERGKDYLAKFEARVARAKAYLYDSNQGAKYAITDDIDDDYDDGFLN